MTTSKFPAVAVTQGKRVFYLTKILAKDLATISYASVRGKDKEKGAVQRLLNQRRIDSIKDFTLNGGDYPNCIILNWVDKLHKIKFHSGKLELPVVSKTAQIIDGQHRVEGIRQAIKEKIQIGKTEIPIAVYNELDTKACADIFSVN